MQLPVMEKNEPFKGLACDNHEPSKEAAHKKRALENFITQKKCCLVAEWTSIINQISNVRLSMNLNKSEN